MKTPKQIAANVSQAVHYVNNRKKGTLYNAITKASLKYGISEAHIKKVGGWKKI